MGVEGLDMEMEVRMLDERAGQYERRRVHARVRALGWMLVIEV
jgi:hypothetical protein